VGKKLGNDYRLWVESATPGTYNMVKGQMGLTQNGQGSTIDTTSKDDFPYGTQAPGTRNGSISVECIPDLPDPNGFTRIETLANAAIPDPFNVQIRKNGSSGADPADVVLEVSVYCTDFPKNYGMNEAVKSNWTLVYAAAPAFDALS
jgi:hypothetical protein